MKTWNRRKLLTTGSLGLSVFAARGAFAQQCQLTPAQTEGPFYPVQRQADTDWDLTTVKGSERIAKGDQVEVTGTVLDAECRPIAGALVEIWQACETGKYNHPNDPNTAELDPDFQYWGRILTDDKGTYRFKTIIPGAYPASPTWDRPPHIHFKVTAAGRRTFTTQMYFAGHPLNDTDLILQSLTARQRESVTVDFDRDETLLGLPKGQFDIVINLAGDANLTPELD